jgi:hypothetical protein
MLSICYSVDYVSHMQEMKYVKFFNVNLNGKKKENLGEKIILKWIQEIWFECVD